jgi:hypothetical protein
MDGAPAPAPRAEIDMHIVMTEHKVTLTIECDEKTAHEISCAIMALVLRITER